VRAVNLLPREEPRRKDTTSGKTVGVIAAVGGGIVVLALAAGFIVTGREVNTQRANLDSARAELAATPRKPSAVSTKRAVIANERNRRAVALASALSQRVSWDRVLRRLALVLPDDIWLTSLAGTTPVTTTDPTQPTSTSSTVPPTESSEPDGLTLDGYAYSQPAVARLLSRLQVVPDLTNVQLKTSVAQELGGRDVVQFTIMSDIRHGSDAS
jgi:Tfp pilus assembly protein PilN